MTSIAILIWGFEFDLRLKVYFSKWFVGFLKIDLFVVTVIIIAIAFLRVFSVILHIFPVKEGFFQLILRNFLGYLCYEEISREIF